MIWKDRREERIHDVLTGLNPQNILSPLDENYSFETRMDTFFLTILKKRDLLNLEALSQVTSFALHRSFLTKIYQQMDREELREEHLEVLGAFYANPHDIINNELVFIAAENPEMDEMELTPGQCGLSRLSNSYYLLDLPEQILSQILPRKEADLIRKERMKSLHESYDTIHIK